MDGARGRCWAGKEKFGRTLADFEFGFGGGCVWEHGGSDRGAP